MRKILLVIVCLCLALPALAEEAKNAPILQVKLKAWDEKTLEKAFLDGRDVEMEKGKYGALRYCQYDTSRTAGYTPQTGQYAFALTVSAEMNGYLSFRSMGISMYDTFVLARYDRGEPTKGEIEGFSLNEAANTLKDKLSQIGVEAGEILRYSAIKGDDFEELRREYAKQRRGEYSEYESIEAGLLREKETLDNFNGQTLPDDGYLLRVAMSYGGIECRLPREWKNSFDSDITYIIAYVTSSGVQYLDIEELFTVAREKRLVGKAPISRAKAERVFKKARKNDDNTGNIARVAYEYAPVTKKKAVYLRPAWCFYSDSGKRTSEDGYIIGAVDAYTGKVL